MAEDFLKWTNEQKTFNKKIDYQDPTETPPLVVTPSSDLQSKAETNADQLAHKMFGAQVRKTLAQWIQLGGYLYSQGLITLQQFQTALNSFEDIMEERQVDVEKRQTDIEEQFKAVIANATVDSELINARDSNIYGKFPTLDGRLENIEQMLAMSIPSGYLVTINHGLGRNPDVTVSYYEDAIGTEIGGFGKAAIFGGTKAKFIESTESYVDANTVKIELPAGFALTGYPVYQPADRCWYIIDKNRILKFDLGVNVTEHPNGGDQSQL
ncbi:hypothetical protein FC84_GL001589 [Lapidilactobacillus dextrinicus DSM 20335]|uniref:Baseplate upper protein immunoglobulin like domain-containing protein n=1 Tax=Lapidilactobacillus dextrinicus DSM 20335 TaxID=1423738 RepID=A0A0R2BKK7_9LACO|nr:hypothetical protein [Lapidilactobacillus dextrinicus]KRM79413.1 hypothetical protein FC84_GL001589 [Lapidilactobacillus dextrinicus DSM 20335]QFG46754.1 hypothetical protein LH506_04520 [Lapidilactobacillus dextrinicus]